MKEAPGFLRLARTTGYVRPLVRDREVRRLVLGRLLASEADPEIRAAAEAMIERLATTDTPVFSSRELQVLAEIRQRSAEPGDRRAPRDLATGRLLPPDER